MILNYVTGAMGPVDDENVMKAVIMLLLPDRLKDQEYRGTVPMYFCKT